MSIEQKIDRAAEINRDADIDALCDGPFEIVDELPHIYNAQSWHSDCADYLVGDVASNDYIRLQIAKALGYMAEKPYSDTARCKILITQCLTHLMLNIGGQIVENAVKNGLTFEMAGE